MKRSSRFRQLQALHSGRVLRFGVWRAIWKFGLDDRALNVRFQSNRATGAGSFASIAAVAVRCAWRAGAAAPSPQGGLSAAFGASLGKRPVSRMGAGPLSLRAGRLGRRIGTALVRLETATWTGLRRQIADQAAVKVMARRRNWVALLDTLTGSLVVRWRDCGPVLGILGGGADNRPGFPRRRFQRDSLVAGSCRCA